MATAFPSARAGRLLAARVWLACVCVASVAATVDADEVGDGYYTVQVGAFREPGNAQATATRLGGVSGDARILEVGGSTAVWYIVVSGRFSERDEARRLAEELGRQGFSTYVKRMAGATTSATAAAPKAPAATEASSAPAQAETMPAAGTDAPDHTASVAPAATASPDERQAAPAATVDGRDRTPSLASATTASPSQRRAARRLIAGNPPPGVPTEGGNDAPEPSMELLQRLINQPRRYDLAEPCL